MSKWKRAKEQTLVYKPLHKRLRNTNSTKNRDWTHVLRKGWESFSTNDTHRVSVKNLMVVYSWIRNRRDWDYDRRWNRYDATLYQENPNRNRIISTERYINSIVSCFVVSVIFHIGIINMHKLTIMMITIIHLYIGRWSCFVRSVLSLSI